MQYVLDLIKYYALTLRGHASFPAPGSDRKEATIPSFRLTAPSSVRLTACLLHCNRQHREHLLFCLLHWDGHHWGHTSLRYSWHQGDPFTETDYKKGMAILLQLTDITPPLLVLTALRPHLLYSDREQRDHTSSTGTDNTEASPPLQWQKQKRPHLLH